MPAQCYYQGDWYEAIAVTEAGESPTGFPDKWVKLEIPAIFQRYLVQRAYSILLDGEGQTDKAVIQERRASAILDDTQQRSRGSSGNYFDNRPAVATR